MSREQRKVNLLTLIWPQCLKKIKTLPVPASIKALDQSKLRRKIEEVLYCNPEIFERAEGEHRNAWRLRNPNKTPVPDKTVIRNSRERYFSFQKNRHVTVSSQF